MYLLLINDEIATYDGNNNTHDDNVNKKYKLNIIYV